MTPEAQRISIAEACGWKVVYIGPYYKYAVRANEPGPTCAVPDYLNDLNAMHAAEASLSADDFHSYGLHLAKVCGYSAPWHATAAQRAEAVLRTLGKWEDGK